MSFVAGWPVYTMVQAKTDVFCRFIGTIWVLGAESQISKRYG